MFHSINLNTKWATTQQELQMLIAEILFRKSYLKMQIDELKDYLIKTNKLGNINDVLGKLYELEDQEQKYIMLLASANRQAEVKIGSSTVPVETALELKRNTSNKIDVLTDLINANKESLDIFNLMSQRNKLVEEYIMILNAIKTSDWSTDLD
jgi:hypothetical protein